MLNLETDARNAGSEAMRATGQVVSIGDERLLLSGWSPAER